jgi:basic amino acid/polyamine antiporter, APA family
MFAMTEPRRELSTFDLTMIAIGSTIGSGIFLTPSSVARALQDPVWILSAWVLGGLMALCGALTYAELSAMMPRAGGVYVYLYEAYGGLTAFLFGWAYLLIVNTGAIAALAIAFATYAGYFVPLSPGEITAVAIGGIILVTLVNVSGVKAGGIFSDVFTLLKLAAILMVIVTGLTKGSSAVMGSAGGGIVGGGFAAAMVGVLFSFGGWQHATFPAAEARNPARSIPLAMMAGAGIVTAMYLAINVAYMFLLSPSAMATSPRLATDAMATVWGPAGIAFIAAAILISTFGTTGIFTLTAPRIYYAMATDGMFFRRVGELHPRFRTPVSAILVQSGWAILLVLAWGTFENLISYVVFTDFIFFALGAGAVLVLRLTRPNAGRPYRTLGYPFTTLFFVCVSIWFVISTLLDKPAQAIAGLVLLGSGIPVYYSWKRRKRQAQ